MKRWSALCLFAASICFATSSFAVESLETSVVCSESFYAALGEQVPTGDGLGHGPDVGSDEWKSVIEFKLGIRGEANIPARDSDAWCAYIGEIVRPDHTSSRESGNPDRPTTAAGPSFACSQVAAGSVEATVCRDEELSALDRKLSEVYVGASALATNEHPPMLEAEQRGWIKGRDECWKRDDRRECVRIEYVRRIAELQARYRLVPFDGPVRFTCDDDPASEVVATYFQTDPPTLIAERGDSVSVMFLQRSGSGSKYEGRNESIWEHQGEASITWGHGAPEMHCRKTPYEGARGRSLTMLSLASPT